MLFRHVHSVSLFFHVNRAVRAGSADGLFCPCIRCYETLSRNL
jgi:hypothetical protein